MKRFLSLLALVVVPAISWAGETAGQQGMMQGMMGGSVDKMKSCCFAGPVSARDETWAARTDIAANWARQPKAIKAHYRSYELYSLNTIQPIFRSEDMHNTFFGYVGVGERHWDNANWAIGLGGRHLTACGSHMFGFTTGFEHYDLRDVEFHGPGVHFEWRTPYTALTYGMAWDRLHVSQHAKKHFLHHTRGANVSSLDFSCQLPYLPWTSLMIGKTWYGQKVGRKAFRDHRGISLNHLDYGVRMNLLGCLAFEGGRTGGFKTNHFLRLVLSFGRPASNEYALTDGLIGNEAFTAKDLRNYGLAPMARTRVE